MSQHEAMPKPHQSLCTISKENTNLILHPTEFQPLLLISPPTNPSKQPPWHLTLPMLTMFTIRRTGQTLHWIWKPRIKLRRAGCSDRDHYPLCLTTNPDRLDRDGDKNTRFYHTKTLIRRRKNKIYKLKNPYGNWCEDQDLLKDMTFDFFQDLYKEERNIPDLSIQHHYPPLSKTESKFLIPSPSMAEIKEVVFGIGSLKFPRQDGFFALFFKENWNILADNFCSFIQTLWLSHDLISDINQTLIALIPKIFQSEFIFQFCPIALCNVAYNWKPMRTGRAGLDISHLLFEDDLFFFVEA
ncbi:hypothetical protein Ahy_A09g045541 isoform A [Arachis hypogaea]|uniref:Reverse transcriptase domain-containing protein n=1 Tax=Arachis hypogaea TaxID=3818 RepID=A0A445BMM4_ARAHY|nr:hypothetical protein Ahy_A09g045541 isoform A [Arachis hypogaea]